MVKPPQKPEPAGAILAEHDERAEEERPGDVDPEGGPRETARHREESAEEVAADGTGAAAEEDEGGITRSQ